MKKNTQFLLKGEDLIRTFNRIQICFFVLVLFFGHLNSLVKQSFRSQQPNTPSFGNWNASFGDLLGFTDPKNDGIFSVLQQPLVQGRFCWGSICMGF